MLATINGAEVSTDAIGNIISDGGNNYTWKNGRQLASLNQYGVISTFEYDASGLRTKRTTGNTTYTYTYDGNTLTGMTAGNKNLSFFYDSNGKPAAVKYNVAYYYYVTNALGDVVAIVNHNGLVMVTYTYDAWGNVLSIGGMMASTLGIYNPFLYRGYVYDYETGHYYIQNRYYNPKIGRFISADSISSLGAGSTAVSYNLFLYCADNPVLYKNTLAIGFCVNSLESETEQSVNSEVAFIEYANTFAIVDQWLGYLIGGADSGIQFWGPGGVGAPALRHYGNGVALLGKGMAAVGFAFDVGINLIENFNNTNLSPGQIYDASLLDIAYYALKYQGVYYLGNESVKIALSAGATTVGVLALDAGLGCALVAGGAVTVAVGVGAAVVIYFLSEGADIGYDYLKSTLFS